MAPCATGANNTPRSTSNTIPARCAYIPSNSLPSVASSAPSPALGHLARPARRGQGGPPLGVAAMLARGLRIHVAAHEPVRGQEAAQPAQAKPEDGAGHATPPIGGAARGRPDGVSATPRKPSTAQGVCPRGPDFLRVQAHLSQAHRVACRPALAPVSRTRLDPYRAALLLFERAGRSLDSGDRAARRPVLVPGPPRHPAAGLLAAPLSLPAEGRYALELHDPDGEAGCTVAEVLLQRSSAERGSRGRSSR